MTKLIFTHYNKTFFLRWLFSRYFFALLGVTTLIFNAIEHMLEIMRKTIKNVGDDEIDIFLYYDTDTAL